MKQERKVIEPNAIVVFERDVLASELNALISESFRGDIVVNGNVIEDEELLDISYNLHVVAG